MRTNAPNALKPVRQDTERRIGPKLGRSLARIHHQKMFHDYQKHLEQVQADHLVRLTLCQELPLKRRGKRERLTPNTALIAEAAARKADSRKQKSTEA